MKQVLWKLLLLHWISSAWYTVFSQAAHLVPPPQFGIFLGKQSEFLINYWAQRTESSLTHDAEQYSEVVLICEVTRTTELPDYLDI